MLRTLILAPSAQRDLDAAFAWLTQTGSGVAAQRQLLALVDAIGDLRAAPCRYPVNPMLHRRERSVRGYRIVYRVDPDTGDNATAGDVVILRVFGPGQDRR